MAIPKILQQLRGGFRIPDQVKQMIRMFKSGDPQAVLNQLMMTNPNMKQVMGIVEQYGGDSMKAFRAISEEMGVDPEDILGMMK